MLTTRKVAVLGPIPHDRVITHNGEVIEKYGCVLYTVAALAALLPHDRICPIVHVRREDEDAIKEHLADLPNVDLDGITSTTGLGDLVELTYLDQNRRSERQTGFMAPITPADVEPVLDAAAFVCVPITDYQVSLGTLEHIRRHSDGFILLDAHGPTSTLTRGGDRHHRLWIERDVWLPYIDVLKMNREEAGCSWFPTANGATPPLAAAPLSDAELPRFADHCLDRGVRAVCVTLDEDGCVIYYRDPAGRTQHEVVAQIPVAEVVDTTGCGDSFAAGMAAGYLQHEDFVAACRYGNAMGAQRCSGTELNVYSSLEETQRQIADVFGSLVPHQA